MLTLGHPVLEDSGSRRRHPRKRASVDRVCVVFVARVDRRIFLLFVKNGFTVGARSLKVTARHRNDTCSWREDTIVSLSRMARPYTILSAAGQTHAHTHTHTHTHPPTRTTKEEGNHVTFLNLYVRQSHQTSDMLTNFKMIFLHI